jgi:hypothetical protein
MMHFTFLFFSVVAIAIKNYIIHAPALAIITDNIIHNKHQLHPALLFFFINKNWKKYKKKLYKLNNLLLYYVAFTHPRS